MKIDRLEKDLAAATLEIRRVRNAPRRRRAGYAAVVTAFAVIIAASWTLHAQKPEPETPANFSSLLAVVKILDKTIDRVTALEKRSSRVKAPFEVVDPVTGKMVFKVDSNPGYFQVFNEVGTVALLGMARPEGGVFKAWNSDQSSNVLMGVTGKTFAGMAVKQGEKVRAAIGFGQDERSFVDLTSTFGGTVVSHLGEGPFGGSLQLATPGGIAKVEAGVLGTAAGLVRTFPDGNPGAGLIGMPGTFITGRSGK